jgi:hypothetical protein
MAWIFHGSAALPSVDHTWTYSTKQEGQRSLQTIDFLSAKPMKQTERFFTLLLKKSYHFSSRFRLCLVSSKRSSTTATALTFKSLRRASSSAFSF